MQEIVAARLRCLACRSKTPHFQETAEAVTCQGCGHVYPVVNGILAALAPEDIHLLDFSEVPIPHRPSFLKMKQAAYFDRSPLASLYTHYHRYASYQRRRYRLEHSAPTCLDIGCGMGEHSPFIVPMEQSYYVGLDLDRFKLESQHSQQAAWALVQGNGLNLPFLDESFEIVQFLAVLEHFAPDGVCRLVREAVRVLRPGGLLITSYPAEESRFLAIGRLFVHAFLKQRSGLDVDRAEIHRHLSNACQIGRSLANSGLSRVTAWYFPLGIPDVRWSLFVNAVYCKPGR